MDQAPSRYVVAIIDGPDPDNYIMALAAAGRYLGLKLVAVIMTGRPVSANHADLPFDFNPLASFATRRDNALHVKGLLMRYGFEDVPVFEGLRAPFSTVPHRMHLHERITDVRDDAHAGHALAGSIDEAVIYLADLEGPLHVVCGGPLTDLAYLMVQPLLEDKLGTVTAQLGMFSQHAGFFEDGLVKTIAGGRKQFNALADPTAAHLVLSEYPGPVYMIPTDITKHPDHAFHSAAEVRELLGHTSMGREIAEMYEAAWPEMWGKIGQPAFMHDFHAAELMSYALDGGTGRYEVSSVGIARVYHRMSEQKRWGEIDLAPVSSDDPERYLASGIDTAPHCQILAAALADPGQVPAPVAAHA